MTHPKEQDGGVDSDLVMLEAMLREEPGVMLERIDGLTNLTRDSERNIGLFLDPIHDGAIPIIYANHQSLADKLILSQVVSEVVGHSPPEQLQGFIMPGAASMESGDQGPYIQTLLRLFDPVYKARGFGDDVPVVTDNDRTKRGMEGENLGALRRLLTAPNEGWGIMVFPEGKMDGGRTGPDGAINGMLPINQTAAGLLLDFPRSWKRGGRETVFLPVGIDGSHLVYPPDEGKKRIAPEVIQRLRGEGGTGPMVTVNVGEPFSLSQLQTNLGGVTDSRNPAHRDAMMARVAKLVSAPARGHYAPQVRRG